MTKALDQALGFGTFPSDLDFRNKIINGDFPIWQRGTTQTASGYGSADRWKNVITGSTVSISRQSFALGQTDVPGNPTYFCRTVVTSVAGASNQASKNQFIESVSTLAGRTATLTFYAKADSVKNIVVEFYQQFGTGGSPSDPISGISNTVTLSTSWQKFSYTVNIPSIASKTLGSDGNDALCVIFWFDAGSNFNSRVNNLGQQSGTFDIARVSLVEGDATGEFDPFSPRHIGQELALCQRYYEKSYDLNVIPGAITNNGAASAPAGLGGVWWCDIVYKVQKRAAASVAVYSPTTGATGYVRNASGNVDIGGTTTTGNGVNGCVLNNTSFAAATHLGFAQWAATAEF